MRSLLSSLFQSAVHALGFGNREPAATPAPAPTPAPVVKLQAPRPAPVVTEPAHHNERFFCTLLTVFYQSSPHVRTVYETWLCNSMPDEAKLQQRFDRALQELNERRAARHAQLKLASPLAPLREDELQSLRLTSDHTFPIKARGAKMEFVHLLQNFLRALNLPGKHSQPGQRAGYLRKEFSFAPLPETEENVALIQEVRASYGALRREVEVRADDLMRLMGEILKPPVLVLSPIDAVAEQIIVTVPDGSELTPEGRQAPVLHAEGLQMSLLPAQTSAAAPA